MPYPLRIAAAILVSHARAHTHTHTPATRQSRRPITSQIILKLTPSLRRLGVESAPLIGCNSALDDGSAPLLSYNLALVRASMMHVPTAAVLCPRLGDDIKYWCPRALAYTSPAGRTVSRARTKIHWPDWANLASRANFHEHVHNSNKPFWATICTTFTAASYLLSSTSTTHSNFCTLGLSLTSKLLFVLRFGNAALVAEYSWGDRKIKIKAGSKIQMQPELFHNRPDVVIIATNPEVVYVFEVAVSHLHNIELQEKIKEVRYGKNSTLHITERNVDSVPRDLNISEALARMYKAPVKLAIMVVGALGEIMETPTLAATYRHL
ncbi:unnamed protein product [Trichogramma brassicae]|uniref:Uncharacterized protein n=1 Tax=Trichogramma brassicae TaxID=86971 RepID=A0A6H5I6V4_9HYME|nr:unnamed protein product [Trichogramma brassicae]